MTVIIQRLVDEMAAAHINFGIEANFTENDWNSKLESNASDLDYASFPLNPDLVLWVNAL